MQTHGIIEKIADYLSTGQWAEVARFFNASDFAKHLGITVNLDNPDEPRCAIDEIQSYHLGGVGQSNINGAVISAMFDLVIGLTALKFASEGLFATTNINIRLVRAAAGKRFYVTAKIKQIIGQQVFAEAILYDYCDTPCAYASGEIRVGVSR